MSIRKLLGFLHLWLGLVSGLVVFLVAVSGCIYVFVDELKPVVYHDRLFVSPENRPRLPVSQLLQIAQGTLGKDKVITRIEVPNGADRSVAFRSQKINEDGVTHWDYYEYYYRVYVNPYSGEVIHVEDTKNEFFQLVLSLHMRLFVRRGSRAYRCRVFGVDVCFDPDFRACAMVSEKSKKDQCPR